MFYFTLCTEKPVRAVILTSCFALFVQLLVDAYLGDIAEYFNAWYVLLAIKEWSIGEVFTHIPFLAGQQKLGSWALPAGLFILIFEPMIYGSLVVATARGVLWLKRG